MKRQNSIYIRDAGMLLALANASDRCRAELAAVIPVWRRWRWRPLALAMSACLGACGGGGDPASTTTTTGDPASTATAAPRLVQELQAVDAQRAAGALSAEQALAAKIAAVEVADKKTAQMTFSSNTFGVSTGWQWGFEQGPSSGADGFSGDFGGFAAGFGYVGIDEAGPYFVPAFEMPRTPPPPPPPPPPPNDGCGGGVTGSVCRWYVAVRGYFSVKTTFIANTPRG